MATSSDGRIVIETSLDGSEFEKGVRSLESSMRKVNDDMARLAAKAMESMRRSVSGFGSGVSREMGGAGAAMAALRNAAGATGRYLATQYAIIEQSLRGVGSSTGGLADNLSQAEAAMRRFGEAAGSAASPLERAVEAMRSQSGTLRDSVSALGGVGDATGQAAELADTCVEGMEGLADATKGAGDEVSEMANQTVASLQNVAMALGLAMGAGEMIGMVSAMTDLESRARIAAQGTMEVADVMERLRTIADRAYSPLEATATAFMNNATALNDIGISMRDQLDLTEALTNALIVSGAKGEQFEMVMSAINRSLATGRMAGRELEMVMKYGGAAAEGMAESLGTTIQGLKVMAREGKLTSEVIFQALVGNLDKWTEAADSMPATINDALVRLRNQMMSTLGELNSQTNFADKLVQGIDAIKNSIGTLVNVLPAVAAGMAAFVVSRTAMSRAVQAGLVGFGQTAIGIARETVAMRGQMGAAAALSRALSGLNTTLAGGLTIRQALWTRITGDTTALAAQTSALVANTQRARENATAASVMAKKEMELTAALASGNVLMSQDANLKALLAQKSTQYTAALEAERAAIVAHFGAQAQHTAALQGSAVARAKEAVEANAAAVRLTQERIQILQAAAARAAANNTVASQTITRVRLDSLLAAQQERLNLLTAQGTVLTAQLAVAQSRASIASIVFRKALTGLNMLVGGPLGLALIGLTVGLTALMTRQSASEKFNERYAESLKKIRDEMSLLEKSTEKAGAAIRSNFEGELGPENEELAASFKELQREIAGVFEKVNVLQTEMGAQYIPGVYLGGLPEGMRRDFLAIERAFKEGSEEVLKLVPEFHRKYGVALHKMANSDEYSPLQRESAKRALDVMNTFVKKTDRHIEGMLAEYELLLELRGKVTRAYEESANPKPIAEALEVVANGVTETERALAMLKELGFDLSTGEFINLSGMIESVLGETKRFNEYIDNLISDVESKMKTLGKAIEGGVGTPEQLQAAKEMYARLGEMLADYQAKRAEAEHVFWAKAIAEAEVKQAERLAGEKLTDEQMREIREAALDKYIALMMGETIAQQKENIKRLKDQAATINAMIANYQRLAAAGSAAAAYLLTIYQANQAGIDAAIKASEATLKKSLAVNEAAMAQLDKAGDKAASAGGGGGGGGAGGAMRDAAAAAEEAEKALREVELTLARMSGNQARVMELENLEALERFVELLGKAGVSADETTAKIDEFKAAQEKQVDTENAQVLLDFYDKLRAVLPAAGAEYARIREEMLLTEAAQLRLLGVNESMIGSYVRMQRAREATDAVSGLRVAIEDYTSQLTPAKAATDLFNEVANGLSDALVEGIWNARDFGSAMANLANTVVAALQRMLVQMLVMKPIMEAMQGIMGMLGFGPAKGGKVFHEGGIAGVSGAPTRRLPEWMFAVAPRFHSGGVAGLGSNEVPAVLRRGEMVITPADQWMLLNLIRSGRTGGGGGNVVNVQVVNQTSVGVDASTQASPNANGGIDVTVLLKEVDRGLADRMASSESYIGRQMESDYRINNASTLYRRG